MISFRILLTRLPISVKKRRPVTVPPLCGASRGGLRTPPSAAPFGNTISLQVSSPPPDPNATAPPVFDSLPAGCNPRWIFTHVFIVGTIVVIIIIQLSLGIRFWHNLLSPSVFLSPFQSPAEIIPFCCSCCHFLLCIHNCCFSHCCFKRIESTFGQPVL